MKPDPIIEEVRRIREEIMAECGNDPAVYSMRLKALQKQSKLRVVSRGPKKILAAPSAK